jgi:D-alanyl-D-alanine carboxypeptidase (penicillin-binding protein 5/6)
MKILLPLLTITLMAIGQTMAANQPPDVKGASVIVVDANSGEVLFERNANEKRPVASTQKLLTSLIVAESGNLDKAVVIEAADELTEPTTLQLKPATCYSRAALLTALLVKSPNDVARALGRDVAGSIEAFADLMNRKAASLGMNSSHFVNPNGLPAKDQYSTAADMSKVARAAYANSTLRPIMATKYLPFKYADGQIHMLRNTNQTMRENWFCTGMKTGYTEKAKHCLVSSGSNNGKEVIMVVLGSTKERIYGDSARMLRWALGLPQGAKAETVSSTGSKKSDGQTTPGSHRLNHQHSADQDNTNS